MSRHTQLPEEQRHQIYAFIKAGLNQTETAVIIGVDKGTISRELKRHSWLRGCRPQ